MSVVALLSAAAGVAVDDGPVVVIDYRPPSRLERSELSGGVDGPLPTDVVKSLCRGLAIGPGGLVFETDPTARHLSHEAARCYVIDTLGQRLARVAGVSAAWLTVSASALANGEWRPGQGREVPSLNGIPA